MTGTGDKWTYSFTNLPGYANGKLITYTVTEDPVDGYETIIVGNNIYNIHQSEDAEPETYHLTIRYWVGGEPAFPNYEGTYAFGEKYSVTSPVKPGYTADLKVAAGVIVGNTVIDVYYTAKTVKLTVFYQFMDGSIAADTYTALMTPGTEYDVISPEIEGYMTTTARVSGEMGSRDLEYIVWYLPAAAEPDPETGRVRLIGGFSGYQLIDDYGVPLGLGEVNRNAGECFE